ncbi:MAG: PucR family transcriptional regulator [Lysinibacillus sp.]
MLMIPLTVADILHRKHFKRAKVIAGHDGLSRQVTWTHILEINHFDHLINGGELILTTGVGLQLNPGKQITFLENCIRYQAAAMCIEIGDYFDHIPKAFIDLANKHKMPIIIFEETVRFIDITYDLHTIIIQQHFDALEKLHALAKQFMQTSLSPNGILKILHLLYQQTNHFCYFISEDSKNFYYPASAKVHLKALEGTFHTKATDATIQQVGDIPFVLVPVQGQEQHWGMLCVQQKDADKYLIHTMELAAMAIVQILLRQRTLHEKQHSREEDVVHALIQGNTALPMDEFLPVFSRNLYHRVVVISSDGLHKQSQGDWQEQQIQLSIFIKSLFKKFGFFPMISVQQHEIVIISFYIATEDMKENKNAYWQLIPQLQQLCEAAFLSISLGISTPYQQLEQIAVGYKEAKSVIQLQHYELIDTYFYKDIGTYRLLVEQPQHILLQYVHDYLGQLLQLEERQGSELFHTLRAYLACNGAKNDTAEQLYIVRQTLYKRLERLESIYGANFLQHPIRLNIELAIKAYDYLQKSAPHLLSLGSRV